MKKYTYRSALRTGLLIGLFILYTLSACVNTRTSINHFENQVNILNNNGSSSTTSVPLQSTGLYTNTMLATNTTPLPKMTMEQVIFITKAIEKDPADLVPNGKPSDWVTDEEPSASVTFKDPTILDEKILEDIRNSDFSIERIKYWLDQGLDIDAQHKATGWSLLIYGLQYDKAALVRYLLAHGADVNIQDSYGFTPLMTALLILDGTHINEDGFVNLLIQYNPDPCIENRYGGSAASLAKAMDRLYGSHFVEKLNRLKKCS